MLGLSNWPVSSHFSTMMWLFGTLCPIFSANYDSSTSDASLMTPRHRATPSFAPPPVKGILKRASSNPQINNVHQQVWTALLEKSLAWEVCSNFLRNSRANAMECPRWTCPPGVWASTLSPTWSTSKSTLRVRWERTGSKRMRTHERYLLFYFGRNICLTMEIFGCQKAVRISVLGWTRTIGRNRQQLDIAKGRKIGRPLDVRIRTIGPMEAQILDVRTPTIGLSRPRQWAPTFGISCRPQSLSSLTLLQKLTGICQMFPLRMIDRVRSLRQPWWWWVSRALEGSDRWII